MALSGCMLYHQLKGQGFKPSSSCHVDVPLGKTFNLRWLPLLPQWCINGIKGAFICKLVLLRKLNRNLEQALQVLRKSRKSFCMLMSIYFLIPVDKHIELGKRKWGSIVTKSWKGDNENRYFLIVLQLLGSKEVNCEHKHTERCRILFSFFYVMHIPARCMHFFSTLCLQLTAFSNQPLKVVMKNHKHLTELH